MVSTMESDTRKWYKNIYLLGIKIITVILSDMECHCFDHPFGERLELRIELISKMFYQLSIHQFVFS